MNCHYFSMRKGEVAKDRMCQINAVKKIMRLSKLPMYKHQNDLNTIKKTVSGKITYVHKLIIACIKITVKEVFASSAHPVIRLNIPMSSYLDLYRLHRNSSGNPH